MKARVGKDILSKRILRAKGANAAVTSDVLPLLTLLKALPMNHHPCAKPINTALSNPGKSYPFFFF